MSEKQCRNCLIEFPDTTTYFRNENSIYCRLCGWCFLTEAQTRFINSNNIQYKQIFDIFGMSKKEYKNAMMSVDKIIGVGGNPCRKSRHTLKMLSGHCPECNPQHVEFTMRWFDKNFVYIAYSKKSNLVKVGVTKNCKKRENSLRETNYGNSNHWKIFKCKYVEKAGEVENKIHKSLSKHKVFRRFLKNGKVVHSSETFDCDLNHAFEKFTDIVNIFDN